jgi:GntR family transcriptional regulator of arabinose operon
VPIGEDFRCRKVRAGNLARYLIDGLDGLVRMLIILDIISPNNITNPHIGMSTIMATNHVDPQNPLPLYYQVYRSLIERIEAGEFSEGKPLPPERQLTDEYSVSRITIIKALAELKKEGRIEGKVGRGTFVIQSTVSGPLPEVKSTLNAITFVCRLISHPYMGTIMSGIAHITEHYGYYLHVISAYENQGQYLDLQQVVSTIAPNIRGAIIYVGSGDAYRMLCLALQKQNVPIVLVERHHPSVTADRVVFNDEETAYSLTSSLIEQGHERIALIVPQFDMTISTVRDRFLGYRRALTDHHLNYNEDLVWMDLDIAYYLAEDPKETRRAISRRLWKQIVREDVTAVLALNPDITNIITQQPDSIDQIRPKNNLTVATFDYIEPASVTPYPMLVALHPSEEIGRASAQLLFDRLNGTVTGAPRIVTVPMKIVTRSILEENYT